MNIEKINLCRMENIRIFGKITIARNIEWTNNSKIAYLFSQISVFQIEKFKKFANFPVWAIPKI